MFCPILCTNYQAYSYQYSLTARAQAAGVQGYWFITAGCVILADACLLRSSIEKEARTCHNGP